MKRLVLLVLCLVLVALPVSASASVSADTPVYVTPTGEKYHRKTCSYTKKARNNGNLEEMTIAEAVKIGLTPCSRCRPGKYVPPDERPFDPSKQQILAVGKNGSKLIFHPDWPVDAEHRIPGLVYDDSPSSFDIEPEFLTQDFLISVAIGVGAAVVLVALRKKPHKRPFSGFSATSTRKDRRR